MKGDRQIWFASGIDNSQMKRDAEKTTAIIKSIGKEADLEGQKLENMFKKAGEASADTFGKTIPHDLKESIAAQKLFIKTLEATHKQLQQQSSKASPGREWQKARYLLNSSGRELEEEKASLAELEVLYNNNSTSLVSLRTQIANVRNEMGHMLLAGEQNTVQYKEHQAKLEELGLAFKHLQSEQKALTSGGAQWTGLISGLQGVMGVYAVGQGVVSMFVTDSEKLLRVQAKLQAVMSIMIGLQQASSAFHQTSAFRITTVRKVTELWAIAQSKVTAALGGSTIAAKLLMGSLTLGLSVAIGAIIAGVSKWQEKQQKLKEEQQEAIEVQKKQTESIANSVATTLTEYKKLQATWVSLKGNAKAQNKFIKENKDAFTNLGVSVSDVNEAENLFVKNEQAFIKSMLVRAKVAAAMELAAEKYKKAIEKMMEAGSVTPEDRQKALDDWMEENHKNLPKDEWINKFFEVSEERNAAIEAMAENNAKERSGAAKLFKEGDDIIGKSLLADSGITELLKKLGIETVNGLDDNGSKMIEAQKTLAKSILAAELDIQKSEIARMKEGRAKELAELDLSTKEKLAKIDEDQQKLAEQYEKAGKKMPAEQVAVFDGLRMNTAGSATDDEGKIKKKYAKELSAIYTQLSDVFLTEEERKQKAINKTYNEMRKQAREMLLGGSITQEEYNKLVPEIKDARNSQLNESLDEYIGYLAKREKIEEEYEANRKLAKDNKTIIDELNYHEKEALDAIDLQFAQREEAFNTWMNDIANLSLDKLKQVLQVAQEELEKLEATGNQDPIALAQARGKITSAQKNIDKAQSVAPDKRTLKQWQELYSTLGDIDSKFQEIGDTVGGTVGDIIKAASKITTSTLEMIDGIKTLSTAAVTGIDAAAVGSMAAMTAAEKASVILAIIAAALQVVTAMFSFFNNKRDYMAEFIQEIDELNFKLEILEMRSKINSKDNNSIFGDDLWGNAIGNIEAMKESLDRLDEAQDRIINRTQNDVFYYLMKGLKVPDIDSLEASIKEMLVQVRHKTWFRDAKYASLGDYVPGLFGDDGKIDMDALSEFIDSDVFNRLSKEHQNMLREMVTEWEVYQEALEEVENYLSNIFGDLGSTMTDALVDAFVNGTDAAAAFATSVSSMLEQLAKEMVYSMTLAPLMKKAEKDMLAIMENSSLSEEEKFRKFSELLADLTRKAIEEQGKADDLLGIVKDIAKDEGFDIFGDSSREGATKGFASMSQDSADELNGRFTVMQGHTFSLSENMKVVTANSAAILNHVAGIHNDTKRLVGVERGITAMRGDIGTIATRRDAI